MVIHQERRLQDKTLEQVADAVGLKKNTISYYEKGKISIPLDNLDAICQFLGLDFLDVLSDVQKKIQQEGVKK
ncbi:MAG: helix-turn-helix domain-containing protein [Solobacterium sp.]|nr:helix-turn-helix domain-containing protein [Solobacterium sp.]